MRIKNIAIFSVITLLLLQIARAQAWSESGHLIISELAYQHLPEAVQNEFDTYAKLVLAKAAKSDKKYWRRYYPEYSAFSYISVWPDKIRDVTVANLFKRYNTPIPSALLPYKDQSTSRWHYTNNFFYQGALKKQAKVKCNKAAYTLLNTGQLLPAISALYEAYNQSTQMKQRAVVVALLVHMLGDLHQPLHNVARVGSNCRHDQGGNGFCLNGKIGAGECQLNLHQWWDRGGDIFKNHAHLQFYQAWLDPTQFTQYHNKDLNIANLDDQIHKWSSETAEYASQVYALPENAAPDNKYIGNSQVIIKQQTSLAVYRLQHILLSLSHSASSAHYDIRK